MARFEVNDDFAHTEARIDRATALVAQGRVPVRASRRLENGTQFDPGGDTDGS